ncbi:putative ABC transporter permease subunit [Alkalihalobacillus trypoxylicola]|uniref:Uncharacterized protein n=1 Tax=Alkalihalobacillus trypoxylicola TaxID=519424 RepID=A0A161P6C5_9BACI|nr:ABC transporter permease [Alkalihalobacillus trypoxylicola]KYG26601.1 hypothetical protein AZF04_12380 [Alkalihalobacillus trypoxylicola]
MRLLLKNYFKNDMRVISSKPSVIWSYIILAFFSVFLLFFIGSMVALFAQQITDDTLISSHAYGISLLIFMVSIFTIPQVFNRLFSNRDLALLYTLPIPTQKVYWSKFIYNFIGAPLLFFLLSTFILIVFGISSGAHYLYYPIGIIMNLLFVLFGMCIAYILNLLLVQIIPTNKAKELFTALTALSGLFVYFSFQFLNINTSSDDLNAIDFSAFPAIPSWLPMQWGGRLLADSYHNQFTGITILNVALISGLTIIFILLSSFLVKKAMLRGWIQFNETASRRRKKNKKIHKQKAKISGRIYWIGKKEWLMISRDLREWMSLLPALFLIFPFVALNGFGSWSDLQSSPHLSWPTLQFCLVFVFTIMTGMFAATSIAREAHAIHLLKVLPIKSSEISYGKYWMHIFLFSALVIFMQIVAAIIFNWSFISTILGLLAVIYYLIGSTAIGLMFGSIGAKYNADNPQNRLSGATSFLLMITLFFYGALNLIPTFIVFTPNEFITIMVEEFSDLGFPSFLIGLLESRVELGWPVYLLGIIVVGGMMYLFTWICLKICSKNVEKGDVITFDD